MLLGDFGYITGPTLADVAARGGGEGEGIYDDTYVFNAGVALGSDIVIETKNGGSDTLTFASTVSEPVTVDLSLTTAQIVNGNLTLQLSAGDVIEKLIGGGGADNLLGNTLDNTITGNLGNDHIDGRAGTDRVLEMRNDNFILAGWVIADRSNRNRYFDQHRGSGTARGSGSEFLHGFWI